MEDWQGCLSPSCQTALLNARHRVESRDGHAITVEDFLLALLDGEARLVQFLRNRGIDQDELIRTIQCEQPIVTTVSGEDMLSSQLQYWFSTARELSESPWLDWPLLLKVLTGGAERLQGKAYVAVLEQVGAWPEQSSELPCEPPHQGAPSGPVVITDAEWLQLAEDVAVAAQTSSLPLIWVGGPRGAGKTSWLQSLLPLLHQGAVVMDLRREAEVLSSECPVFPEECTEAPALVLDNLSPADLEWMLGREDHVAQSLVMGYPGAIVLVGPDSPQDRQAVTALERLTGRPLERYGFPAASVSQIHAVLTAHQSRLEKRWRVQISASALAYAARMPATDYREPGKALELLERAAARVVLFAEHGPRESLRLAGEIDSLRQQHLVALARQQPVVELESALQRLSLERAASEVGWHERNASGRLYSVLADDVRHELERRQLRFDRPRHPVLVDAAPSLGAYASVPGEA